VKRIIQRVAALVIGLGLGFGALAGLETVTHISDLNSSWPLGSDLASTSDDHIRNIKVALKTDFPNINAAVTGTPTQLNNLTGSTASAPGFTVTGSTVPANGIYLPSANTLGFASNTTARGSVNSNGNWTMPAASSGTTLALTGIAGGTIFSATDGTVTTNLNTNAGVSSSIGTSTAHAFALLTNGSTRISIASTGAGTYNAPSSGTALQITGASGANTLYAIANSTSGSSFGMRIDGGTTSADRGLLVNNQAGTTAYFQVRGDGAIQGGGTVAAALVDMTPDKGTFTITYTGMTASVTGTASWVRMGNVVVLTFPLATGTSNLTTFTATGLPSAIQPASLTQQVAVANCENVGTQGGVCQAQINSGSGTINMLLGGASAGWTNSGVKGIAAPSSVTYSLL
jgi:hypothetical protein